MNEGLSMFSLKAEDAVILDDLKPAVVMSQRSGVKIAAAGWAYDIKEIRKYMSENCDYYLDKVENLKELLFS